MNRLFALALASLMLVACGNDQSQTTSTQATPPSDTATASPTTNTKNPNWETVIVATQSDYPPFSFKDEQGTIIGFERELIQAIATASQLNVDIIEGKRSDLATQLDADSVDIWVSTISITPERQAQMAFSEPYLTYQRSVLILDNELNAHIKTLADLQGKTLSYSAVGSKDKEKAIAINKDESLTIGENSTFLAIKNVYSGKSIGATSVDRVLSYYALQYPNIPVRQIPTDEGVSQIGFALKKGNTDLQQKINAGFAKIKEDGTYDKLMQKWFGESK